MRLKIAQNKIWNISGYIFVFILKKYEFSFVQELKILIISDKQKALNLTKILFIEMSLKIKWEFLWSIYYKTDVFKIKWNGSRYQKVQK